MASQKGKLFIISAPSGSGKTTLCEWLVRKVPRISRSISLTTRPLRKGEKNGRDYFFVDDITFREEIKKNNLLEWAKNFGQYYGTPKDRVLKILDSGRDVILAIDVKGAMKVRKLYPKGIFIFISPPSIDELRNRLRKRKTDGRIEIAKRIRVAKRELAYLPKYNYSVVNDNLKKAAAKLEAIVTAERCKIS